MTSILDDNLKKKDARALAKWWNANSDDLFFVKKMDSGKFYEVVRQHSTKPKP